MRIFSKASMVLFFTVALAAAFQLVAPNVQAQSSYFTSRGCINCHSAPVVATCNGCHHHGESSLAATASKTSYTPGETVTVTLSGGSRSGWIGARLYDQTGAEVARSTGNQSGMGSSTTFPAALSAPAPATAGSYTWKMAYFGNNDGTGTGDVHSETAINVTITVASAADIAAPTITAFTLPGTATSLTVSVTAFTATDNVAVTGYLINKSATAPAASAAGWTTTAPVSVTAVAGSNSFYAWVRDAAGNVSLSRSATVVVTITTVDITVPVVTAFTLPATATSLTVPVSAFTATDNVAVTGYMINKSATAPSAAAAGWTTTAPTSVIAVAGSNTFYAWAKDAAGNVSASRSATDVVTIATADITPPTLTVSALANGSYTNKVTLNVSGSASDAGGLLSVTVNGQAVVVNADGSFSTALTLMVGANTITAVATDQAGNQTTNSRMVTYDPTAPVLTVSAPADNSTSVQSFITVSGTVSENSTVTVSLNGGTPQSAAMTGTGFTATVNLVAGVNTIDINATNLAGTITSAKRTVTYSAPASQLTLAVTNPPQDVTTSNKSLTIRGTVTDASGAVKVVITVDNHSYTVRVSHDGNFSKDIKFSKAGTHVITVTATDLSGNTATVTRNVIYRPHHDNHDKHDEHGAQNDHVDD